MSSKKIYKILSINLQKNSSAVCSSTGDFSFSPLEFEVFENQPLEEIVSSKIRGILTIKCPQNSYCGKKFGFTRSITFKNFNFTNSSSDTLTYEYEDCDISPADVTATIKVQESSCGSITVSNCHKLCGTNSYKNYEISSAEKKLNLEISYEIQGKLEPVPSWSKQGAGEWLFNKLEVGKKINELKFFYTQQGNWTTHSSVHYAAGLELNSKISVKIKLPNELTSSDVKISQQEVSALKSCFSEKKINSAGFELTAPKAASDFGLLYRSVLNDKQKIEEKVKKIINENTSFQEALTKSIKNQIEKILAKWRAGIRSWAPDSPGLMQSSMGEAGAPSLTTNNMVLNGFPIEKMDQKKKFPYQITAEIKLKGMYNIEMNTGSKFDECCIAKLKYNESSSKSSSSNPIEVKLV